MSRYVFIQPTKFVDLAADGTESKVSYGLRIGDDEECTYTTFGESPEAVVGKTPAELYELARGVDDVSARVLGEAMANGDEAWIGDSLYDLAELAAETPAP